MRLLFSHPATVILGGMALCFAVSWGWVFRLKHPYLVFISAALFSGATKSFRQWDEAVEVCFFALCFACGASAMLLMVRESLQNVQRVQSEFRRRREEHLRQLLAEAEAARKPEREEQGPEAGL